MNRNNSGINRIDTRFILLNHFRAAYPAQGDGMISRPSILIVIPVFNRPADLAGLIAGLSEIDRAGLRLHIVVIDDHSDIPVVMRDEWRGLDMRIIRNERRLGPARSRNRGVRNTDSDYIWFLDSDARIINPEVLSHLIKVLQSAGGIVEEIRGTPMIMEGRALINFMFLYEACLPEQYPATTVFGLSATNFFITRADFLRVNGFDERLKREEDVDLCLRLKRNGGLFYQSRDTAIFHRLSGDGRKKNHSRYYENKYRFIRTLLETRLLLLMKHAPGKLLILPLLDGLVSFYIVYRVARNPFHLRRIKLAGGKVTVREILSIGGLLLKHYLLAWISLARLRGGLLG